MKRYLYKLGLVIICALAFSFSPKVMASEVEGEIPENTPVVESIDIKKTGYYIDIKDDVDNLSYTGNPVELEEIEVVYKDELNPEEQHVLDKECYTVTYENNTNVGVAKVIVTGVEEKGYRESIEAKYQIKAASIANYTLKLSATSVVYDGKVKTPSVTVSNNGVTLKADEDYTVTYSGNINIGTAKVTVKGIGNYTGTLSASYKIYLQTPTMKTWPSASKIKLTWNKVTGASGYQISRSTKKASGFKVIKTITSGSTKLYTDKNKTFNKTYYYKIRSYCTVNGKKVYSAWSGVIGQKVQVARPIIKKASTTYSTVKITWDKKEGASGYAVYRSSTESGGYERIGTVKAGSKVTFTDKKLKSSTTYFYKVKAYRTVNGKRYYGYASTAKKVTTSKKPVGWKYVNGYKLYYDANGKLVKDVSSIIGKQSSYVIKVNKKKNVVTVYAKDGSKGYIIPVKSFVCSTGAATPLGTFKTPNKYRWHTLDGPSYGQWCTRITGSILFHSVWYYQPKNTTLSVAQYNKLGTQASHGCVRLTAADAKWIYDNCKLKTKVIIYNSNISGPFGKPTAEKLASWHTWDPTDPNTKSKCKAKGCH